VVALLWPGSETENGFQSVSAVVTGAATGFQVVLVPSSSVATMVIDAPVPDRTRSVAAATVSVVAGT